MLNCAHVKHTTNLVRGSKVDIEQVELESAFVKVNEKEQMCTLCGLKEEIEND